MSRPSKDIMLKSVGQSLAMYAIRVVLFPISLCDEMEIIMGANEERIKQLSRKGMSTVKKYR